MPSVSASRIPWRVAAVMPISEARSETTSAGTSSPQTATTSTAARAVTSRRSSRCRVRSRNLVVTDIACGAGRVVLARGTTPSAPRSSRHSRTRGLPPDISTSHRSTSVVSRRSSPSRSAASARTPWSSRGASWTNVADPSGALLLPSSSVEATRETPSRSEAAERADCEVRPARCRSSTTRAIGPSAAASPTAATKPWTAPSRRSDVTPSSSKRSSSTTRAVAGFTGLRAGATRSPGVGGACRSRRTRAASRLDRPDPASPRTSARSPSPATPTRRSTSSRRPTSRRVPAGAFPRTASSASRIRSPRPGAPEPPRIRR